MVAVIFEVIPKSENEKKEYLDIAASLKSALEKMEGFISIERFQSLYHPEKILSLSFWKDDESVKEWRTVEMHRAAQKEGRNHTFKDYRLRVATVMRDYGMFSREEAPEDSKLYHDKKQN
jgi:heme-degrading monooxygenase HmoA